MDNIPRYIEIKEGKVEADYMHPNLKPYLEETYGIMVYQEQVMQAAQALSGYTLGAADLLRRAMGKKIQAEMDAQRQQFVDGAVAHSQVTPQRASEIFDQIDKFAGYGFNKSHAAAYALISYWTGWLKANYPVEFMAASMTLDVGNTDKLAVFKQELDKMGIPLLLPDINHSEVEFAVEGNAVRYALAALKGIGAQAMDSLVAERRANGPYKSMADLASRIDPGMMNRRQFEQLASAGAFDSFGIRRSQAHSSAETMLRHAQSLAQERAGGQTSLFGGPADSGQSLMPELPDVPEWDPLEKLSHEFDAVGFYLSAHPLDSKAAQLERMNIHTIATVNEMVARQGSVMVDMAGVLLKKNIKVSQKSGNKFAFLQLSDATGIFEVMLFSETLSRARDHLEEGKTLLLKVMAESRDEQIRFTAQDVKSLESELSNRLKEVHIHISSDKPLGQLDQLLKTEGRGKVAVKVFVPVRSGLLAEVTLPGQWNFSAAARNALLKSSGVEGIQEL
jgi:DNA polymerase-3 subunit alpha